MESTNRRVRRTHRSLHNVLMSLILEKNYDAITVQQILDRADVGRSTFYAHFDGKDELLLSGTDDLRNTLDAALQEERLSTKRHDVVIGLVAPCLSTPRIPVLKLLLDSSKCLRDSFHPQRRIICR